MAASPGKGDEAVLGLKRKYLLEQTDQHFIPNLVTTIGSSPNFASNMKRTEANLLHHLENCIAPLKM